MIVREKQNKTKKQLDFKSGFENPKNILPMKSVAMKKQNTLITYAPSYHC